MYIIKNAFRNMTRNKGKNILIGIIVTVIVFCTCISLSIHKAGENLVETYKETNPLEISFSLNMQNLRHASDDDKNNFQSLTIEDIKNYTDSKYVKDYYYTLESSLSSENISPVDDNIRPNSEDNNNIDSNKPSFDRKMTSSGDFRITAYSNFAYLKDFTSGDKKIKEGSMIDVNNIEKEIVISETLAEENDLNIDSEITFYIPTNKEETITFKVVGIYEDNMESEATNFMNMNALNSSNQIYTNITSLQEILEKTESDNSRMVPNNGLNVKIYLKNNNYLEKYTKEVKEKGLSSYYEVTTNENEILQTLQPIQNISSFSLTFLIVILIIGIVVLSVINFLNIRDRKYEIGVLRAIGMNKTKVTALLIIELFFVALISLFLGTITGALLSQPVTNKMLENEISSYKEDAQNIRENFGGGGFERPSQNINPSNMPGNKKDSFTMQKTNTEDFVNNLQVKLNITTIIQLFTITILLTITSGIVASMFVNKYNPNKILQNRI